MIKQLRLYHFRNFEEQKIDFSPGANIFIGNNGQGKSNILESIYVLFTGESFRPASLEHLILNGRNECSVTAQLDDDKVNLKIQDGRKAFAMNEKKVTRRALLEKQALTLFSPESLNAIKGSPDERRQLVDELALFIQPEKEAVLSDFKKALRTRNKVLKDFKLEKQNLRRTEELLDALRKPFLALATEVTVLRIAALKIISPHLNSAMLQISKGFPELSFEYQISEENGFGFSHQDIHNSMQKRMVELRAAELSTGHSLVGPHKHDLLFLFGGKDSRFYCSQGQQRSLILAFKLAQVVYHRKALKKTPILLLDDVLSELDGEKRNSFVELIKDMDAQIVITTTDFDLPRIFMESDLGSQSTLSRSCTVQRVVSGTLG